MTGAPTITRADETAVRSAAAPGRSRHLRRDSTTGADKRWDIEGLRAIAVALVVLYHADLGPFHGGFVGVDVFFVISGFLITGLMLREFDRSGRISISGFYARRLRRIVPAGTLTIIATIIASGLLLGPVRIGAIAEDGLWSAIFLANFRFLSTGTDYFTASAPPSPLQHFWSLAVEEQFYVVWPLALLGMLLLAQRVRRHPHLIATVMLAVLSAASLAWCIQQTSSSATQAYFSPWTRAWELGAGALLALTAAGLTRLPALASAALGTLGLVAIAVAALGYDDHTLFPGAAAVLPVAGTVALLAAGAASSQLPFSPSRLAGIRPLRYIGGLSYTIYLWHWPILIIAMQRYPWLGTGARVLLVVASIALSALTHALVENPIRFAPSLVGNRMRAITVGLLIVVLGAGFANAYVVTADGRVEAARAISRIDQAAARTVFIDQATVLKAVAAAPRIQKVPNSLNPPLLDPGTQFHPNCDSSEAVGPGTLCWLGDSSSAQVVVIMGDSHAGTWSYPLDLIAKRTHFKLALFTLRSCPVPSIRVWDGLAKGPYTGCDTFRQLATERIKQLQPGLVILSSEGVAPYTAQGQPVTAAAWTAGLKAAITTLSAPQRRIVVIGDIPVVGKAAPAACLSVHLNDVQACSVPADEALQKTYRDAEQLATKDMRIQYVDPAPWVCSQVCTTVIANFQVYQDRFHLTGLYASYLAGSLSQALDLGK
jgi:peptidoglycan/LPS O-acetylase OafA/YrhL